MKKRISFVADDEIFNSLDLIKERWEAKTPDAKYTYGEIIRLLISEEHEYLIHFN